MEGMQGLVFSAGSTMKDGDGHEPPDGKGGLTHGNNSTVKKISFKDMVMGDKEVPPPRPKVDLLKENLAHITYEDNNPLKPKVHINKSVLEGLYAP